MKVVGVQSKKELICRIAAGVWLAGMLVFIFGNSLASAAESSAASGSLREWLNSILSMYGLPPIGEFAIRKLAHFAEFFLLGMAVSVNQLLNFTPRRPRVAGTVSAALCMAILDELLQFTSAGRSPRVTDVLIDLLGIVFGVLFVTLIYKWKGGRADESKRSV